MSGGPRQTSGESAWAALSPGAKRAALPIAPQHPRAGEAVTRVLAGCSLSDVCAALDVGVDTAVAIV